MLKNVDPGLLKILAFVVAAGLAVAAHYFPSAAEYLYSLATGLVGSAFVRRPGDAPVAGVHVDDIEGSNS
jgi:hypothetical protein